MYKTRTEQEPNKNRTRTEQEPNKNRTQWSSLSKFLFFSSIILFSVHCSKKKGGGLGLGALALAGGGGSSSSSSSNATETVTPGGGGDSTSTKCQIKGNAPKTLGINYSLSYECELSEEDYGKTLSLQDDKNILEISKKSFPLPQTKKASGNFKVKTKKNQNFSITPKIESKSFTKKDFSATKNLTGQQIKIEQFDTTGLPDLTSDYLNLEFFKDKFFLFHTVSNKYYSSSDGKTWKDEGQPHTDYTVDVLNGYQPLTTIYKDKLYLYSQSRMYSVASPDGTNFTKLGAPNITFDSLSMTFVVLQDKLWFRNKDKLYSSKNGTTWTSTTWTANDAEKITTYSSIVKDGKIWTFGGETADAFTNKVYSFSADGNTLTEEGQLRLRTKQSVVQIFASGFLVFGGDDPVGNNDKIYYSPDGKTWSTVKTDNRLEAIETKGLTLTKENEIWAIRKTDNDIFKITFTE